MKYDGSKQIKDGYFVLATDKKAEHLIRENSKKDYKIVYIVCACFCLCGITILLFFMCKK